MSRESFPSRLGFLPVDAGNVWRFPYVTGANGGVFVLFCILFPVILVRGLI